MEAEWPVDCRFPQLSRRRCRCESKASSRWRSRPSRHCPRSWVVSPAQGVVQGGVGMGGGAGVGCGLGVCPRPVSADPGPRPHVSRRPSTAPASGAHSAPTRSGSVSGGRRRTAVLGPTPIMPVPPVLPEYPEEQLESWTLDNTPLKGAMEGPNVCAVARGRMWHGEDGGRGAAPVDDDAVDNLREARVVDNSWSRPPPAATPRVTAHRTRPPTMDDGSVRSSVITAASAACSSIATSSSTPITSRTNSGTVTATSGTAPTTASSQATSRTASLEHPYPYHTTVPETVLECIDDLDSLDPLAVKTFHDDSQGSDIVLPVRAEAGTDPVAELDEGLQGLHQLSTPVGERARKRRKDARRRPPARYRVPLYEYHPTLQALQGRRSRSEGGALDAEGAGAGGGGARQPRVAAETRRRRVDRLAQPNYRHDSRMRKAEVRPNLSVGPDPIWPISKAALRASPTTRVSMLSMAPARRSELHANVSVSRSRAAHASGSVTSRLSARLEALSKPRLSRAPAPAEGPSAAGSQRRLVTDAEWRRHKDWLRVNAQPRRDHSLDQQRGVRRGRSASLRRLLPRLRVLAKPSHRSVVKTSEPQLKTVSQGALRYQASERIIRLSQPLQRRLSVSR